MSAEIAFIAPEQSVAALARGVFREIGEDIPIEVGYAETAIEKANLLVDRGIKIIIARGDSHFIRKCIAIPVVEITITAPDIAKAIFKASKLGNRIAIVGYNNLVHGLEAFNPLFKDIDLLQVFIRDYTQVRDRILELKEKGVEVIIGGTSQCIFAREQGLNSVFVESSPEAIYRAYEEAKSLLSALLSERRKAEEVRAILDHSRDGYIAINEKGIISSANLPALRLMQCGSMPVNRHIRDAFPILENLSDVLSTGQEYWDDVIAIGMTTIVYHRVPVVLNRRIIGAIAILQDAKIVREAETKIRNKLYTKGLFAKYALDDISGKSREIKTALALAYKFARTNSTILIMGETGTGKELFAQGMHNESTRRNGPFVGVNCASLPESILESELFGYEEGAFTGARKQGKPGLFELAHGGTIFLDEISEIPLALQGRLLRVLQERSVMRLGSDKIIPIDVRIIAATNRNLGYLVAKGTFREDLFFRINVLRLQLPPLRERTEDIHILAEEFLGMMAGNKNLSLSRTAFDIMERYSWPGNMRELQNLIERIAVMSDPNSVITAEQIHGLLGENAVLSRDSFARNAGVEHTRVEHSGRLSHEAIDSAIKLAGNNKGKAAEILGIHRTTLWRWLKSIES